MTIVRPSMVIVTHSSSLGAGRLSTGWPRRLLRSLKGQPECKGPLMLHDMGHGGWTSLDLLNDAANVAALNPTHALFEGGSINSSVVTAGVPARTRAQQIADILARVAIWQAERPGIDLTIQTMNPVSAAGAALRPNLADYYADEVALAATSGWDYRDHYADWVKPLPDNLSNGYTPQTYAAPAGYAIWDAAGAFNPADKNAAISLANNNLQMISAAAGDAGIRGTPGKNAGKLYFEVQVQTALTTYIGVGLATADLTHYTGFDANAYGFFNGGAVYNNAGAAGGYGTYGAGDIIGVAVDFGAGKIFFAKNNTWLNGGNPATGAGGVAIAAGTYYPMVSGRSSTVMQLVTGNIPGDGLHPILPGGVDTYLEPSLLAWGKTKMAAFWP